MNEQYIERYWRDAKPEDAIREPPMMARFGNGIIYSTLPLPLAGTRFSIKATHRLWYTETGELWTHCQVYDAPDPGEGWRLIDVDIDKPQEGDEYFEKWEVAWKPRNELSTTLFVPETFYRRRIEQPKPEARYEPFKWEDREQLRGRLITFVDHNRTVEFRCESFAVDDGVFSVNHIYADWLCKHAVFVDTKEPVGRRVE